jgi:hypothetical protein
MTVRQLPVAPLAARTCCVTSPLEISHEALRSHSNVVSWSCLMRDELDVGFAAFLDGKTLHGLHSRMSLAAGLVTGLLISLMIVETSHSIEARSELLSLPATISPLLPVRFRLLPKTRQIDQLIAALTHLHLNDHYTHPLHHTFISVARTNLL